MPIFYQQDVDADTKLAVWKIEEEESFFLRHVPLQREIAHPHKRLQHLAGRYLLRLLYPDFPIELIRVADTRRPYLEDEAYHFSISHCGDYAAAIVSSRERVGVDIELVTEKVARISNKFLHAEEKLQVEAQFSDLSLLTLLWSAKEAVFKWWSYGKVDFSEQIRLEVPPLAPQGLFSASYHEEKTIPLQIEYRMFDGMSLAWVKSS